MRRVTRVVVVLLAFGLVASPAAAHNLEVSPPGNADKHVERWIGGPPGVVLPDHAQGDGLFPGPPFAPDNKQPAAHGNGLNTACASTSTNPVVTIYGPPTPAGCPHGT